MPLALCSVTLFLIVKIRSPESKTRTHFSKMCNEGFNFKSADTLHYTRGKKIEKKDPKKHLEMLPIYFNQLKSQLGDKEIDVLAVSIGPGSFTGLRIGLGFAKGLALGLKIPIIPVPTLQILAFSYKKKFY